MRDTKQKLFGSFAAIAAVAMMLPMLASADTTSFVLSNNTPTAGGSIAVNGTCANTGTTGTVTYSLVTPNGTFTLPSGTVSGTGTFNNTITLPTGVNTGAATLVATCPGGVTLSQTLFVGTPSALGLTLVDPTVGTANTISGLCAGAANGTITLSLLRDGVTTNVGTTVANGNGNFTGTLSIPATYGAGPVTVVATCPDLTVRSQLFIIGGNGNLSTNFGNNGSVLGVGTTRGTNGSVLGVSTPRGGVAAGFGGTSSTNASNASMISFMIGMMLLAGIGLVAASRLEQE